MTPEEVLEKAAEYIAERGWHQGSTFKHDSDLSNDDALELRPPACAMGAIAIGTGKYLRPGLHEEFSTACDLLGRQIGGVIPNWNDAPERTAEEVILTLKKAARHEQ